MCGGKAMTKNKNCYSFTCYYINENGDVTYRTTLLDEDEVDRLRENKQSAMDKIERDIRDKNDLIKDVVFLSDYEKISNVSKEEMLKTIKEMFENKFDRNNKKTNELLGDRQ